MDATPTFSAVHHVALNVSDLARSVQWYADVLGFSELFAFDTDDFDRKLLIHPSGVILALSRHRHDDAGAPFNERTTGLDHLSLAAASEAELQAWAARFDALGVTHSGVTVIAITGSPLLAFRDPDGIQLELYAPPEQSAR